MRNMLVTLALMVLSYEAVKCVNIATRKPAAQSSTFEDFYPNRAVDGNKSRDLNNVRRCSHTDVEKEIAWWQVDLENTYIITGVTITPRQWTETRKRLAGYSIYVSNVSRENLEDTLTEATLCYKYPLMSLPNIDNDIVVKCSATITGSFVIIYNERKNGRNYPFDWSPDAVLELCEVEVSVQECPTKCDSCPCTTCKTGWYGEKCEQPCSNCAGNGTCYKNNGYCKSQSCKDRYYGPICTKDCSKECASKTCDFNSGFCHKCNGSFFGENCREMCPSNCLHCYNDSFCETCNSSWFGGTCQSKCSHCGGDGNCGKIDGFCLSLSCKVGYYGRYCNRTCSEHCTGDGSCNFTTGQCRSCPDGLYGISCQTKCRPGCKRCNNTAHCLECYPGMFGSQCNFSCPGCGGNGSCLISNGRCMDDSCKTGYHGGGGRCNETCPTNCGGDESCDINSGDCLQGCVNGFTGPKCNVTCPTNCGGDRSCDVNNQTCLRGCKPGWRDTHCDSECDAGWFGEICSQQCDRCRNNSCNHITGVCQEGCRSGWSSSMCDVAILKQTSDNRIIPVAAGGAGVGLVVIVIALLLVLILIRRRRRSLPQKKEGYDSSPSNKSKGTVYTNILACEEQQREHSFTQEDNSEKPTILQKHIPEGAASHDPDYKNVNEENTYYNSIEALRGIGIDQLREYIMGRRASKGLVKDFKELPYGAVHPTTVGQIPKNVRKNRFKSTLPYDHSRIKLSGLSDYINANFIEDMEGDKKYIATQGPLEHTIAEFWQMVWENNVGKIVMLTNLKEGDKNKCTQYWPDPNSSVTFGLYHLTQKDQREYSYFVFRELKLENTKAKVTRKILHYHFTQWPDHGTPDPLLLVLFHQRVIASRSDQVGPDVVHCSAGIGRTGTYIALDALERYGRKYNSVDIRNYVRIMRRDRMNMVQTSEQYEVLHEALVEAFQWKDTSIAMDSFPSVWEAIVKDTAPLNQQKLKTEYESLKEMTTMFNDDDTTAARKEDNKAKHRLENVLAPDKYRPYLTSYLKGGSDYINAVTIPSFTRKTSHFVSQVPLPGTIVDFWRLLDDHESFAVIYFASEDDEEIEFYPEREGALQTKLHDVQKLSHKQIQESVSETKLQMTNKSKGQSHNVVIWKVKMGNSKHPTPAQLFAVCNMIEVLSKRQENTICTVLSLDGCSPCDVYCTVSNTLEYMKIDNQIDIFQTARQLLLRRPEFFKDYETYRYCYQVIHEYLATESVYFNS